MVTLKRCAYLPPASPRTKLSATCQAKPRKSFAECLRAELIPFSRSTPLNSPASPPNLRAAHGPASGAQGMTTSHCEKRVFPLGGMVEAHRVQRCSSSLPERAECCGQPVRRRTRDGPARGHARKPTLRKPAEEKLLIGARVAASRTSGCTARDSCPPCSSDRISRPPSGSCCSTTCTPAIGPVGGASLAFKKRTRQEQRTVGEWLQLGECERRVPGLLGKASSLQPWPPGLSSTSTRWLAWAKRPPR